MSAKESLATGKFCFSLLAATRWVLIMTNVSNYEFTLLKDLKEQASFEVSLKDVVAVDESVRGKFYS
jgi:hypothetical protein